MLGGAAALYATRLSWSPVYLHHDEAVLAVNAHAIATSGRDVNGVRLPLYVHITADFWAQPIVIYWTALFVKLLGISENTIRLPTVMLGLANIVLLFAVGRRVFRNDWLALLAAGLLALTPAHFIHSRLAMDYLYPVPFLLAWLWCLLTFLDGGRSVLLFWGGLLLGIGFYSYIAGVVMMPLYLALTVVAVYSWGGERRLPGIALTIAAFLLPLVPLVPWALHHPDVYADQIRRYKLYNPAQLNPAQGAKEFLNYTSLTERASLYWSFFDPSYFFFSGGSNLTNSTRQAGVFLLPFAVFLPAGLATVFGEARRPANALLLAGFLTAPAAALLVDERYTIDRELELLPFAILIGTFGIARLYRARNRLWRIAAAVLLIAVPLQFRHFYRDYMGEYRVRSAYWFERNVGDAFEDVIARDAAHPVPAIYVGTDVPWGPWFWNFYTAKHDREAVNRKIQLVRPIDLDRPAPTGSLLVVDATDASMLSSATRNGYRTVREIADVSGNITFDVLER